MDPTPAAAATRSDAEFAAEAHEAWLADWRFLSGNAELHSGEFDAPFRGLDLPRPVLDKVYRENARRVFPTAWRGTAGSEAMMVGAALLLLLPPLPRCRATGFASSSTGRCEAA